MLRESEAARRARVAAERQRADPGDVASRYIRVHDAGSISIDFPRHFGVRSKKPIKLSGLERYPLLAGPIAAGVAMYGLTLASADSRHEVWNNLKLSLLKFLADREDGEQLTIGDVDTKFLKDFKAWLDRQKTGDKLLSKNTRTARLMTLQHVLEALLASKKWRPMLANPLDLIKNPYPGAHLETEHVDILDDVILERLYVAAAADCEKRILDWRADQERIDDLVAAGVKVDAIDGDPFRCAAHIIGRFPPPLPTYARLPQQRAYGEAISTELYQATQRLLYPTLDDLLPFILLLALMFAFNPGVVLNMTHDDYEDDQLFGRDRIRLKPFKPRANRNQVSVVLATDDLDNPKTLLAHLESRTAHIRPHIRDEFADRVFLKYSPGNRKISAVEQSDDAMRLAIASFCARHKDIEPFQLRQIRPTTLDLVHEISGGDLLAMQQIANHADANTTLQSYTRAAFHRRNEEMLSSGMMQLERKYRSQGRVDPATRNRLRTDLGSATPGFACADPYDSPLKGERKGRLCQAYCRCPICPLAMIDASSAEAYAYLMKLRDALDEAAGRLGAPWLARWGPVREKLTTLWSRLFTDEEVIRRGVTLAKLAIPDLPKLD